MSKLQNMRIIEMPKFRAVSSGPKTLDELLGFGTEYRTVASFFVTEIAFIMNDFGMKFKT